MTVYGALSTALSGLRVTQAQLDVVAANVSNAETPGYTRKTITQSSVYAGYNAVGVQSDGISRQLDELLQRQIRSELGASGYVETTARYHDRLNSLMGAPGSASSFDSIINNFGTSLSALGDNPSSQTAQQAVVGDAQVLIQTLNAMSADIQSMRAEADQGIATSVQTINDSLQRIEEANNAILSVTADGDIPADLLDERDRHIDVLAQELDIQVLEQNNGSVTIFTSTGVTLFSGTAARLDFEPTANINPLATYSVDSSQSDLGTVRVGTGAGGTVDLLAGNNIRSGRLAGYVEARDEILPEMQARLDEFAHQLALAMSLRPEASEAHDPVVADTAADLGGTGTFATIDFTNGGANDGSISFDLTVDGVTQTIDITYAEANVLTGTPATVDQTQLVDLINQEANTAFGTVGVTYAVADGTAIDLRSNTTGAASNVSVASYSETNLAGVTTLADGSATGGTGFDGLQIDLTGIQPGNEVSLNFTDTVAGQTRQVTLVHVTDAGSLPLSNEVTANPDDLVIGVDLTDPTAVSAALAANGIGITAGTGTGGDLQLIDDGATGQYDINSLSANISVTGMQTGEPYLPMFTDGIASGDVYTASQDGLPQKAGFASRIQLNSSIVDDPSLLSMMDSSTPAGDTTRATYLYDQFNSTTITVSAASGIGAVSNPFETTLAGFGREIVNRTAFEAASAERAREGQEIVTNGLLARQSEESAVDIDEEMARLTELQTIYAANAQVMNAAREMMDLLLNV